MMRRIIAGLIRVSTEEQVESGLVQQHGRLKDAGAERIYIFVGSRDSVDREDIDQLLNDVRKGEIEKVLITRMDRVTASPGLLETLSTTFNQNNTRLISLDENIDLTTIDGEFSAMLSVVFAGREVKTTRQRIKKGNEYRRSQGISSSPCPLGYVRRDGKYVFDQRPFVCLLSDRPSGGSEFKGRTRADLAIEIKEIFFKCKSLGGTARAINERYGIQKIGHPSGVPTPKRMTFVLDGEDISQVVNHLKKTKGVRAGVFRPCASGIKKLLLSPVWSGNTHFLICNQKGTVLPREQWQIRYDTHEDKILTLSEQEQVKRILEMNYAISGYNKHKTHLLTGLIRCAHCNYPFKAQAVKQAKEGVERRYQCRNYCQTRSCFARGMITEVRLEQAILDTLIKSSQAIANAVEIEPQQQPQSPELIQLRQKMQKLEHLGEDEPEITALKERIRKQIEKIEQRSHLEDTSKNHIKELLISAFSDAIAFQMQDEDTRRAIYLQLIDHVSVEQKEVSGMYRNGKSFTNLVATIKEVKLRC
ncbi:recombinase family protein [Nostoc sp. FACHB-190]|uniref:recombinase family protein n=1 Tax=Nostoc sp. FACHB-190 TaxID=2692838 RepID=UPI0028C3EF49|nr:recombinase family protein [Nostoc sp. FACHB-190]